MKYYANFYKYNDCCRLINPLEGNNKRKLWARIRDLGQAECSRGDKVYIYVCDRKTDDTVIAKTYQY